MEKIVMLRNSPKYGFQKGDEFPVLRDINDRCVMIRGDDEPNLVWPEEKAVSYGSLSGEPQLGG